MTIKEEVYGERGHRNSVNITNNNASNNKLTTTVEH